VTVHVLSVGVSLQGSLCDPRQYIGDNSALVAAIEQAKPQHLLADVGADSDGHAASDWLTRALAISDSDPAEQLAEMSRKIRPHLWPRNFSAELDTFARDPKATLPVPATDIVLLISSDTPDGLLAGVWNAVALADGDLGRVRFLAEPEQQLGHLQGCCVVIRVPGLDAGSESGFRQAMRGLGLLGRNLLDTGGLKDREPFRFYLSGGFKAAIPYLIGLAEGLASIPDAGTVEACVLHETAKEPSTIRLPLRRIAPERVWRELSGLSETPVRTEPVSDYLDGYAYEETDGNWQLTAFGVGLKALFGEPPPGLRI
jgi:hypothetical protein